MRLLIQRVKTAEVFVSEKLIAKINQGLLLFLGISSDDEEKDIDYLVNKFLNLRLFSDQLNQREFDRSIIDVKGEILLVSQFTLYASCVNGRRPDFSQAGKSEFSQILYEKFVKKLKNNSTLKVETGQFGAMMDVHLINDGPVTILLES